MTRSNLVIWIVFTVGIILLGWVLVQAGVLGGR
jgi:hypothetical protein